MDNNQDFKVEDLEQEQGENTVPSEAPEPKRPSAFREIMSWVIPFVIAVVLVYVLKTYVIINANVPSGSMENTIMTGDNLIGFRLAYQFSEPKRGDVIIFPAPDEPNEKYIKRIIGLPGEKLTIKEGKVYINGELLEEDYLSKEWLPGGDINDGYTDLEFDIPEDSYFVMGDNRTNSHDARFWNNTYVTRDKIIGKAIFIYWPFADAKWF